MRVLLGLLAQQLLGLGVVDQNLCQVLLVQDKQVGEAVRLHVGGAPVPSAPRQQADQSERGTAVRGKPSLSWLSNILEFVLKGAPELLVLIQFHLVDLQ